MRQSDRMKGAPEAGLHAGLTHSSPQSRHPCTDIPVQQGPSSQMSRVSADCNILHATGASDDPALESFILVPEWQGREHTRGKETVRIRREAPGLSMPAWFAFHPRLIIGGFQFS